MAESTPVSAPIGRPSNRSLYSGVVREAEKKFVDKLPELADSALELALGRKPETCPYHHEALTCPAESCTVSSRGKPVNEKMVVYALNRIMGTPTGSLDKAVNMEFVQKVGRYVAEAFNDINGEPDAETRRVRFAESMVQMWALVGDS